MVPEVVEQTEHETQSWGYLWEHPWQIWAFFFSSKQAQEHLKQLRFITSALMDSAT